MGTHPAWWVPRENSFFRETLGESAPGLPRIGVFGGPAALPPRIPTLRVSYPGRHSSTPMGSQLNFKPRARVGWLLALIFEH